MHQVRRPPHLQPQGGAGRGQEGQQVERKERKTIEAFTKRNQSALGSCQVVWNSWGRVKASFN